MISSIIGIISIATIVGYCVIITVKLVTAIKPTESNRMKLVSNEDTEEMFI
jgi:hypothetical protein